jgi:hypothetical protein
LATGEVGAVRYRAGSEALAIVSDVEDHTIVEIGERDVNAMGVCVSTDVEEGLLKASQEGDLDRPGQRYRGTCDVELNGGFVAHRGRELVVEGIGK